VCIITDCELAFHLRRLRTYRHRILYAGNDLALSKRLWETLKDCQTVRAPGGTVARLLIRHINYSLLLFDHALPDTTGAELAEFTRALPHRALTRIVLRSASAREARIVEMIARLLATSPAGEARSKSSRLRIV
jgi:CheY-like chemotaxis protein